jgi:hypothetical protein
VAAAIDHIHHFSQLAAFFSEVQLGLMVAIYIYIYHQIS